MRNFFRLCLCMFFTLTSAFSVLLGSSDLTQNWTIRELKEDLLRIKAYPKYDTFFLKDLENLILSQISSKKHKYAKSLKYLSNIIKEKKTSYKELAFIESIDKLIEKNKVTEHKKLVLLVKKNKILFDYFRKNSQNFGVNLFKFIKKNFFLGENIKNMFFRKKDKNLVSIREVSEKIDKLCKKPVVLSRILKSYHFARVSKGHKFFVKGKIYMCAYQDTLAKKMFYNSYKFIKKNDYRSKINILSNQARIYRRQGLREKATRMYVKISRLWTKNNKDVHKKKDYKDIYLMMNHYAWAARYQSLIGKQKIAKMFIAKVFKEFDHSVSYIKSREEREKLAVIKAEAYYILAFKIFLSEKKYKLARNVADKSLKDNAISSSWKNKMRWVKGLYFYIEKKYDQALVVWEEAYKKTYKKENKEKIAFWILKLLENKNNIGEKHRYYLDRLKKNPNSFYYLTYEQFNKDSFSKISKTRSFNAFVKINKLNPDWIEKSNRFKILSDLKMYKYLDYEVSKFRNYWGKKKSNDQKSIYNLAEFFHKNKLYHQNVLLISRNRNYFNPLFKEYTEKLSYLYPRPHPKIVDKFSIKSKIDSYFIYAISRQESLFNTFAISPAGARGFMQLMPKTARMYGLGKGAEKSLLDPEKNIKIAFNYLKFLKKKYIHNEHVLAAYNAGEYVVDIWKENKFSDPLLWVEFIPFFETRKYVKNVLQHYLIYKKIYLNTRMVHL